MTDSDICNLTLAYLGALGTPISNLQTDSTPTAQKFRAVWEIDRKATLRDHAWKFATKIEALSEYTEKTVVGWSYVYAYPSDCLNILRVFNEATLDTTPTEEYDKINKDGELVVVSECDNAYVKYTADITNPELFDASYCEALAWKLAMSLAVPLTGDQSKQSYAANMYKAFKDAAQNANLNEGNTPQETTCDFIEGRG